MQGITSACDPARRGSRCTGSCNDNRIDFEEMTSWRAQKMHLGMKTALLTKYIKQKMSDIYYDNLNIHIIIRKCIL